MRDTKVAAAIFAVTTFCVASVRASLNPDRESELLDPKRVTLVLAGAFLFWMVIKVRKADQLDARRIGEMARVALPGIVLLFGLAMAWDFLVRQDTVDSVARNIRWILLWSGYFGTALAAWLALQYQQALHRAERYLDGRVPVMPQSSGDIDRADDGFWVKTGRQTVRIARSDIEWIEAEGNYARIHGADAAHGLMRMSLAAIEAQLDGDVFIRVHRSAICRRSAIRGYRRKPSGAMLALLASGAEAPVGRNFAKVLTEQARSQQGPDASDEDVTVSQDRGAPRIEPQSA